MFLRIPLLSPTYYKEADDTSLLLIVKLFFVGNQMCILSWFICGEQYVFVGEWISCIRTWYTIDRTCTFFACKNICVCYLDLWNFLILIAAILLLQVTGYKKKSKKEKGESDSLIWDEKALLSFFITITLMMQSCLK